MVRTRSRSGTRAVGATVPALLLLALAAACSAASPATPAADNGSTAGGPPAQAPAGPTPAPASGQADAVPDGTHIVRTGRLTLEVTDLAAAIDAARHAIAGVGGHVGGSEERHAGSGARATVTYRIPVERWEDALAGLRGLGRVTELSTDSSDVTSEVVDLEARLTNLRTTEAAFQVIMDRAESIADVLRVQEELTTVRGQIERVTAQRDSLSARAALATLTVSYQTATVAAAPPVVEGWSAEREIDSAVTSLVAILQRLATFGIWLGIVVMPVLLPFAIVGLVAYRVARWRRIRATMQPSDPRH